MELQKFTAPTMPDALALVERALGEQAVILDAKTLREEPPGQPPREYVEVWAQAPGDAGVQTGAPTGLPEPGEDGINRYLADLREELHSVHSKLEGIATGMSWLGSGAGSPSSELAQYLAEGIAQKLPVSGGIHVQGSPHVVTLLGATGVGKSTMIAKLAWHFRQTTAYHVGLVSLDTLRIGGTETLRAISRHLEIPLEIVYLPEKMPEALARLSGCDVILIDTPGISPRDTARLDELRAFLVAADPREVHLVIHAGASSQSIRETIFRYAVFQPDQVILTKVDEAPALLEVLPLLLGAGLAVSYLSDGPALHAQLQIASPGVFARLFTEI